MLGPTRSGVGVMVGVLLGVNVGVLVGVNVGGTVGVLLGVNVGGTVGILLGVLLGVNVGGTVGILLGVLVGIDVGVLLGATGAADVSVGSGLSVGGTVVTEGAAAGVLVGVRPGKGEVNWVLQTGPGGMLGHCTPGIRSCWPGVSVIVPLTCVIAVGSTP